MEIEAFPLHRAAEEGDLQKVKKVCELGVSVDSRDDDNYTPLHWAARRGRYEVVEYLILKNCDLNPRENHGRTPLLLAAFVGCSTHLDVMNLLIRHGADVKCCDSEKSTLLHRAAQCDWVQLAECILERGGDVNAATANGQTPLIGAAIDGSHGVAALLIRAGADVNSRDTWQKTALHYACPRHYGIIRMLLEKEGCDLNAKDEDGNTPLHMANPYIELQEVLLVAGASPFVRNNNNETAFSFYIKTPIFLDVGIIRLFVQQGAFFEDSDYEIISSIDRVKEGVLKVEDLCTQLIVNKFNHQSLPAVYTNPDFAEKLPRLENLKIKGTQNVAREIANFVENDIQKNPFCNVMAARPLVLTLICVKSLLNVN